MNSNYQITESNTTSEIYKKFINSLVESPITLSDANDSIRCCCD